MQRIYLHKVYPIQLQLRIFQCKYHYHLEHKLEQYSVYNEPVHRTEVKLNHIQMFLDQTQGAEQ